MAARRFSMFLLASLAAVALLLALGGVYGESALWSQAARRADARRAALLIAAAAGLACYHPARDAMRVDVLTAIRDE